MIPSFRARRPFGRRAFCFACAIAKLLEAVAVGVAALAGYSCGRSKGRPRLRCRRWLLAAAAASIKARLLAAAAARAFCTACVIAAVARVGKAENIVDSVRRRLSAAAIAGVSQTGPFRRIAGAALAQIVARQADFSGAEVEQRLSGYPQVELRGDNQRSR